MWCGVWAAQCAVCDRNARHGMSWRGGNGFGDVLRQMEIYFAQYYGFLGYFECVFAMLSSNVGESEKTGFLLLLAQIFNGSLTTKDAGILPAFVAPSCTTSCRTLATKRFARGLVPPKAYNLALSWTGTYFLVAMVVVLNIYNMKLHLNRTEMNVSQVKPCQEISCQGIHSKVIPYQCRSLVPVQLQASW